MSAKLSNLNELSNILTQKEKADERACFFKTVQNYAAITAIFGSEKARSFAHVHIFGFDFEPFWRTQRLCCTKDGQFGNG
jgi:hypothetical protein